MRLIRTLALSGLACGVLVSLATAGERHRIEFPDDYRSKQINYVSLDRTQHADQLIRLFASARALEAVAEGRELPEGTKLVAEVYKAKKDENGKVISNLGRRVRGDFAAIAVMEKRRGWGEKFPKALRNGDWDFAVFSPSGERLLKKDLDNCRRCHAPLTSSDHVFSLEHMRSLLPKQESKR